jgi:hypothetical protein
MIEFKRWITSCARKVIRRLDDRSWENSRIALLFTCDEGLYQVIDLDGATEVLTTDTIETAITRVRELASGDH